MWPWGHLAVGYLMYSGDRWLRYREQPRGWPVIALAAGALFPDVVDKPLAYWFTVVPSGRSLAHSLFALVAVYLAFRWAARRYRRSAWGAAFALGYASHLIADSYVPLLGGRFEELTFLLWPALPSPEYDATGFSFHYRKLAAMVAEVDAHRLLTAWNDPFVVELWLVLVAVVLWARHRAPPLPTLRVWVATRWGGVE